MTGGQETCSWVKRLKLKFMMFWIGFTNAVVTCNICEITIQWSLLQSNWGSLWNKLLSDFDLVVNVPFWMWQLASLPWFLPRLPRPPPLTPHSIKLNICRVCNYHGVDKKDVQWALNTVNTKEFSVWFDQVIKLSLLIYSNCHNLLNL